MKTSTYLLHAWCAMTFGLNLHQILGGEADWLDWLFFGVSIFAVALMGFLNWSEYRLAQERIELLRFQIQLKDSHIAFQKRIMNRDYPNPDLAPPQPVGA